MKKIMLMVALILGFANLSQAQSYSQANMTPEDRANMQTSRLTKALSLTDDQSKKVKAIFLSQAKSMDSLRSNSNGDFSTMGAARKTIMDNTDAKLNTILTDDQKKAYEQVKAERRARMQGGGNQN